MQILATNASLALEQPKSEYQKLGPLDLAIVVPGQEFPTFQCNCPKRLVAHQTNQPTNTNQPTSDHMAYVHSHGFPGVFWEPHEPCVAPVAAAPSLTSWYRISSMRFAWHWDIAANKNPPRTCYCPTVSASWEGLA